MPSEIYKKNIKDLKLFYLEDDEITHDSMKIYLSNFFKNIYSFYNGKDALDLIDFGIIPDVIITDINMPILDGIEFTKKVKILFPDVPVIFITAHGEEVEYLKAAINLNVEKIFTKPLLNIDLFISSIENAFLKYKEKIENRKFLNEYKKAIDESTIVSKTDITGTITYVNKQFCKSSGYTQEELLGKKHNLTRHEDMSKEFFQKLWETILDKRVWRGEIKNKRKNGGHFFADTTIVPILDNQDNIQEFVAVRRDITDIIDAKIKIEEANKTKTEFLANMSHEVKTPLNSIKLISSYMSKNKKGNLNEKDIENLSVILKCGNSLLEMITEVLDIADIENGNIKLIHETFNLNELMQSIKVSVENQVKEKNLNFSFYIDENLQKINSSRTKIKKIVNNLLSNALKFSLEGTISLKILDDNENFKIIVEDEGIGIEPEKITHIFDKFTQIDGSTTRRHGGVGLGLAICKELVNLMNGKIEVESEIDIGSKFIVTLPKNI